MSQAAMLISPVPQFFDNNGKPLAGGLLEFYLAGTLTPQNVYSDSSGTIPLGYQITLDSSGRAKVWLVGYYHVFLYDALGNLIWSEDNVSSAYQQASLTPPAFSQWQAMTDTLTYIGPTQFSMPGDQTTKYLIGSRIQATVTAGTVTGSITAAASSGVPIKTTVTVHWDLSEQLDAGLSAVSVGIVSAAASGMPIQIPVTGTMDWYPSLMASPFLPWGWVRCDGQVLVDPLSPLNGSTIPNLNGASSGADTFNNNRVGVFTRGGNTSGVYAADTVKAHQHNVTGVRVNAHTHSLTSGAGTTDNPGDHVHSVVHQYQNVGNGSTGSMWQDGPSNPANTLGAGNHTHNVTLSGNSGNASTNLLTGSVDANEAATETAPKTVTVVKIMRVK